MIKNLTQKQINLFPEYIRKYKEIGLSTKNISDDEIKNIINKLHSGKLINHKNGPVIIMDNPIDAWYATIICNTILSNQIYIRNQVSDQVRDQVMNQVGNRVFDQVRNQVSDQVSNQVWDQIWDQVGNQVSDQVGDQVMNQVMNQVRNQVWDQVSDQVWDQVWNQIGNRVFDQVRDQVMNQVMNQVRNFYLPYLCGSYDVYIFSFFDYMINELYVKIPKDLKYKYDLWKSTLDLGIIYPLEGITVVCKKPTIINKNNLGLHCENGPAVAYKGFELYYLNGCHVPEWLVKTPANEIDPKKVLEEKNVQIRREILRKIGINSFISKTNHKLLDTENILIDGRVLKYDLLLIDLGENIESCPALSFEHASIPGIYLIEWVDRNCKTVRDALEFRNKTKEIPLKIA